MSGNNPSPGRAILAARLAYRRGEHSEAASLYDLAANEGVLDVLALTRFGAGRLAKRDIDGAIELFEKGLAQKPEDVGLITCLACAREMQGQEAEAVKLYRFVIAHSANAGIAFVNLGYKMLVHGNVPGAIECLQRCLEAPPSSAPVGLVLPSFNFEHLPSPKNGSDPNVSTACLLLGLKLQESGRFEESGACFAHAIRCNLRNGSAYGALVLASKLTQQDTQFIDRMVALSKARDLGEQDRTRLFFALGKAMDDLGEYERAMSYVEEARRRIATGSNAPFDRDALESEVGAIIETYTYDRVHEAGMSGSDSEVPLPIVGMMRSGSTLVEQIVSSHPEVAAGDELSFWRDHAFRQIRSGVRPPTRVEATDLSTACLQLLRDIDPDAQRVTDKMPHNFMAIGLIHRVLPNARIICCHRHPVDVCLSIYMTDFRHSMPFVNDRGSLVFFYRQFERLMDHWRKVIPADRLLEVQHEELLGDPEAGTRRLIEFCGLDWDDACLHPEENRRAVKTASVVQVRQKIHTVQLERWRRYEPWLGELRELMPD